MLIAQAARAARGFRRLFSHYAQAPAVLDHSRTLAQRDRSAGPTLTGGEKGGECNRIFLYAGGLTARFSRLSARLALSARGRAGLLCRFERLQGCGTRRGTKPSKANAPAVGRGSTSMPCACACSTKLISCSSSSTMRAFSPAIQRAGGRPIPFRCSTKPQRCYTAPHESRRNRRSCCQAAAGSTRPLPPLVHRIRGGPHQSR
jgi:hypothetical protein